MVNCSRMRDVGDTRQDFEELDSAISSGLYLKDAVNRQGEDFYYMHTRIEVTAEDQETLEQRVTAGRDKALSSARRADFRQHPVHYVDSMRRLMYETVQLFTDAGYG